MCSLKPNCQEHLLRLAGQTVCPLCRAGGLVTGPGAGMVSCPACRLSLVAVGGLAGLQEELDTLVEKHGSQCGAALEFSKGDRCLMAICPICDFCQAVGGI